MTSQSPNLFGTLMTTYNSGMGYWHFRGINRRMIGMWKEICDEKDIANFMEEMCYFHDSCVKELKYLSGAYVTEDLSMYPINDKRQVSIIVQRQYEKNTMIEMVFEKVEYLKLFPVNDEYTCEILEATMFWDNGFIYWCDTDGITRETVKEYEGLVVCASKFKWRPIQ